MYITDYQCLILINKGKIHKNSTNKSTCLISDEYIFSKRLMYEEEPFS
jgi:hypothetical protein